MGTLHDIEGKDDLIILVDAFYGKVQQDALLGSIFNSIIEDWDKHLQIMYGFWNSVLFGAEGYKGQAVAKHVAIDQSIRLEQQHYDRWIALWNEIVDTLFTGVNTELIKTKAKAMLQLIQFKVEYARSGKFLA